MAQYAIGARLVGEKKSHTQSWNSLEVTTKHTLEFSELVEKTVRITVAKTADNPSQILNWPWRTAEGSHDTESGYKITDTKQMPRNAKITCSEAAPHKAHFVTGSRWASNAPAKDPTISVNRAQKYSSGIQYSMQFSVRKEWKQEKKYHCAIAEWMVNLHVE